MKIVILLGSIRKGRQSHKVAHYLEQEIQKKGFETDLIDLAEDPLPILEEKASNDPQIQRKINNISQRLDNVDALLFVTPEYHGSFSGVIKNALDYFWSEFSKKAIGVVTVSSGKLGGINASTQLQHVILSLGAFPLPVKLLIPEVHLSFNEQNEPQSDRIVKSTHRFVDEFLWLADAVYQKKSLDVVKEAV